MNVFTTALKQDAKGEQSLFYPSFSLSGNFVGVVRWLANQIGAEDPIRIQVGSPVDAHLTVTLARLEKEVARQTVKLKAGQLMQLSLDPDGEEGFWWPPFGTPPTALWPNAWFLTTIPIIGRGSLF